MEKYIGDAVMCVFGLPTANEDDALRAVRGALDLAAGVAELSADLRVELGVDLAVRVGVNTGEVVAGDPSSGQALATGDAVNTAARLQQAAPIGGILLGELTYRLVSSAVRARAVTPIYARGKSAPLAAWRLLGPVERPAGCRTPHPTSSVARRSLRCSRRSSSASREAHAEIVLVCGEAGIGKSRLVAELSRSCPRAAHCPARARATAAGTRTARCGI